MTYENTFEINMLELEDDIRLDLGEVYETVVVFLNGERIGIKMWAPYQFVIDRSYVKNGENHIKIEVTNSMANQMDNAHLASGLIDRKSTRLNSSHVAISYAVFCLKKKNK